MNELQHVDTERLEQFANRLAQALPSRVVIGLRGTLGAGKTRLVQAFAVATGVDRGMVTSPTFTIVQHYRGDRLIHHIDAYRLADEDEFIALGGEELLEDDATVFIEWPERISECLPQNMLVLDIDICDDPQMRTIRASCRQERLLSTVSAVFAQLEADWSSR